MIALSDFVSVLQGTFPELLRSAANSVVCTQRTDLLERLFNQTYSPEKAIRFPTSNCRSAISRCEQCLNQLRCVVLGKEDPAGELRLFRLGECCIVYRGEREDENGEGGRVEMR